MTQRPGERGVLDWNVVVCVKPRGYAMARDLLREYGEIQRTGFSNILVMKVASIPAFLEALDRRLQFNPDLLAYVSRIAPATMAFDFDSLEQFEAKSREIAMSWLPSIVGKSFHVRIHRRGLRGTILSPTEERILDQAIVDALDQAGTPGVVSFDDPDLVLDIETMDHRAGMALWTRSDLSHYLFLKAD